MKIVKKRAVLTEHGLGGIRLNISRFSWIC